VAIVDIGELAVPWHHRSHSDIILIRYISTSED
jgi:hypothetical protein